MCGSKPKPPPPVVQRDPVADQRQAEAEGQQAANSAIATRRRRRSWTATLGQASLRSSMSQGNAAEANTLLAQATPEG